MNFTQLVIMLTEAITDPVFAVVYGFFTVLLALPGVDLGTLLRGIWSIL